MTSNLQLKLGCRLSMDTEELVKALRELALVPFSSIPFHKFANLSTSSADWKEVLKWKGAPDRVFYITTYDFDVEWAVATGKCIIRVTSNGEEVAQTNNDFISEPSLYWFSMGQLRFEGVNPAGHLAFFAKSDGTNTLLARAEICGLQVKL